MVPYNIISTGSKGNAVVINDAILVDCGVPYKWVESVVPKLKLVLLTHIVNPSVSVDGRGLIPVPGENIWYTPMYFRDIWHWRRLWYGVDTLARKTTERAAPERKPEPGPAELKENKLGQLTLF